MSLKKKKNIIVITLCVVVSFILYQLYFFLTLASETNKRSKFTPVFNDKELVEIVHLRSHADRYINDNGILRGVLYSHMPKYRPDSDQQFKCLKSEEKIPFDNVNDDFCDCEDGTDEPSTNACVNGTFYCDTQASKPISLNKVPSGKVNDGICDCCDGSDEWLNQENQKLLSQSNSRHYRYYVSKCHNMCK